MQKRTTAKFPIVGIGASFGGTDAFHSFVSAIPPQSGMAYIYAYDVSDEDYHPLKANASIPIIELDETLDIRMDHIYVVPQSKRLQYEESYMRLVDRTVFEGHTVLDDFFTAIAKSYQSYAIGIMLSGPSLDGGQGLKNVKENGGITYAQSLETAIHKLMPQAAVDTGGIDFILPPKDMPEHLLHIKNAYQISHSYEEEANEKDKGPFKSIIKLLHLRTGNDFSHYKEPTLRRRIARRMVVTRHEDPEKYLQFLQEEKEEQDALFNDVLIPVSFFFRDAKTFDALSEAVLPLLFQKKKAGDSLRIWVAGCSTGEEAYSLAICVHEFCLKHSLPAIRIQIFATDISEKVIAHARNATYSQQEIAAVSTERLEKYFKKIDGRFQINKTIRELCVFAVHNFLKDPPFSRLEMVSCRNVLIYFDQFLQKKALTSFHYALNENGILMLGNSEATNSSEGLFTPVIKAHKIYARKGIAGRRNRTSHRITEEIEQFTEGNGKKAPTEIDLQTKTADILLSEFTPSGVIVDDNNEILHFHGDTTPFLAASPGKASFNVIKMARAGLGFELRSALQKSLEQRIKSGTIPLKNENYYASFEIIPIPTETGNYRLILFTKIDITDEQLLFQAGGDSNEVKIKQLEAELYQLREDIRRVTEEQEVANEELQSANEELLSNSEELQTLNEELETAAEDLQSNNEELKSVNDELRDRQEQLIAARLYAEAVVETISEPLLIFDKEFRVKSANKAFYNYFNTTEDETVGHLLTALGDEQWNNESLMHLLSDVIPNQSRINDFELTANFPHIGKRSLMLNAMQVANHRNAEPLILLAFTDVTELKLGKLLRESEARFRMLADTAPVLLWVSNSDSQWTFFNKSWLDFRGKSMEDEIGNAWRAAIYADDIEGFSEIYEYSFRKQKEFNIEFRLQRRDGNYRWISYRGVPRLGLNGEFLGFIGGAMDIDEQKNFAVALEGKVATRTKELKASESFLHSVLNTTQNFIYVYDYEKQKIVFANSRAVDVTGHKAEEFLNGADDLLRNLVHQDDIEVLDAHRVSMQTENIQGMRTVEFRIWNGKEWAYQFSRDTPFQKDASGNICQYLGVATDISEMRNINEELLVKNRELQAINLELASFTSIASHDLKEPLRKIMMFSKLIIDRDIENVSDTSRQYLERVVYAADRMQQLIDDLITYSQTGSENIRYVKSNLNDLLAAAKEELSEPIKEKNAAIVSDLLPTTPVIPSQITQLFVNLIGNAIKYSRKEILPKIEIKMEKAQRQELLDFKVNPDAIGFYKIELSDNGIGFHNDFHQVIFEPFKRLHSTEEFNGTGIGLAICKKIMENHKGFISATGTPGQGSKFSIFIPDGIKRKYPQ